MPDLTTQALRRQATRRNQTIRQLVRLKSITQSVVQAHLLPHCPHADLLGSPGKVWLLAQYLPLG